MAHIEPFRAVRYNSRLGDLSLMVSQPYDRVLYGLQEQYYAASPYNVVRIIRGKDLSTDVPDRLAGPNVYTRAQAYYELWLAEQVLIRDPTPAIYAYHQIFAVDGQTMTRKGFISALELSAFDAKIVLPHERTHSGPKIDRLRLLRTLHVHTGQIFVLYPDPQNRITALLDKHTTTHPPDVDLTETFEKDVRQRLWVIAAPEIVRAVQAEMAPKKHLIIADGHHRYETALTYRDLMHEQYASCGRAAFNYCMATLVSMDDPKLVILPTHREVLDCPLSESEILGRAAQAFTVFPAADMDDCLALMRAHESEHAFGFYAGGRYNVLVLQKDISLDRWIDEDRPPTWKSLDVSIVHKILLEKLIGLSAQGLEEQTNLRYHRSPQLAVQNIDAGQGAFVLLLNSTRIDQVKACAEQGAPMPQKSTDFYPKMIAGLTMLPVGPTEHL
jgi:uncharacterized protein (DUF1015 family)